MLKFPARIPFVDWLGLQLQHAADGESAIEMDTREEMTNSWGVTHGGVTMSLLDVAMAQAARTVARSEAEQAGGVVTVEMKTMFMRAGSGRLRARGRLLHRTATLAFCEAQVHDETGQIVGQATGTFKYVRGLTSGGRRIHRPQASD